MLSYLSAAKCEYVSHFHCIQENKSPMSTYQNMKQVLK